MKRLLTTSTDIDEQFEYSDDEKFTNAMLLFLVSGFILGSAIATALIYGLLSAFEP